MNTSEDRARHPKSIKGQRVPQASSILWDRSEPSQNRQTAEENVIEYHGRISHERWQRKATYRDKSGGKYSPDLDWWH